MGVISGNCFPDERTRPGLGDAISTLRHPFQTIHKGKKVYCRVSRGVLALANKRRIIKFIR